MTAAKVASLLAAGAVILAACSSDSNSSGVPKDGGPDAVPSGGWSRVGPATPFSPLHSVWAAGSDVYATSLSEDKSAFVFSSHDRGGTWTSAPVGDARTGLTGVAASSTGEVYAVGYTNPFIDVANTGPLIAKSTDGGATFTMLTPDLNGAIFAVGADAQGWLFVAGEETAGGFFARSTDGGLSWTKTLVSGSSYLSGLWVSAAGEIYAAGGAIFKSTDGGDSWTAVDRPPIPATAISGAADGARVVATGAGLLVVESRDGGATWQMLSGSTALAQAEDAPQLGGVWVADATSDPYFAAGTYGVLRTVSTGDAPGTPFVSGGDFLPDMPIVSAVTGDASDVWAVGEIAEGGQSAIYRKTIGP